MLDVFKTSLDENLWLTGLSHVCSVLQRLPVKVSIISRYAGVPPCARLKTAFWAEEDKTQAQLWLGSSQESSESSCGQCYNYIPQASPLVFGSLQSKHQKALGMPHACQRKEKNPPRYMVCETFCIPCIATLVVVPCAQNEPQHVPTESNIPEAVRMRERGCLTLVKDL